MTEQPKRLSKWDEIQQIPVSVPPENFSGLSTDEGSELIKEWFFKNFEDPIESTPHDSSEGGYHYIWGGPYDAQEIIKDIFTGFATGEMINNSLRYIEKISAEWVPNSNRRIPPEEDQPEPEKYISDNRAIKKEIDREIDYIETFIEHLPVTLPGAGHNNPPGALDSAPLSSADIQDLQYALTRVKSESDDPKDHGQAAYASLKIIKGVGNKILKWMGDKFDVFLTEAAKESGKEFGKWAPRAIAAVAVEKIFSVSSLIEKWLMNIDIPF